MARSLRKGDDLIEAERGFIGGFVHAAREYPDVQVMGSTRLMAFTAAPREAGKVESFEHFMSIITDDLKASMPVDGVYLALHGAMAVEAFPDRKPR